MVVGHLDYIKIGHDGTDPFCFVYLKEGDWLVLWWIEAMSTYERMKRNMWISLLREAIAGNYEVELLTEDEDSVYVVTLKLIASSP
ncbi:MAG: hypothetical protein ACFFG0_54370 [Candidatus Thorarchaeota archaeon]